MAKTAVTKDGGKSRKRKGENMEALVGGLREVILNWTREQIENEQKRQKDAEQPVATMQELQREFQAQDAKPQVDAFQAHLDDLDAIIRRAEAQIARQRAKRDGI
jgi:hypothetical protein